MYVMIPILVTAIAIVVANKSWADVSSEHEAGSAMLVTAIAFAVVVAVWVFWYWHDKV